ncbi:MAG: hypothetical protein ACRCX5_14390 [Bacteroidales bacterium]
MEVKTFDEKKDFFRFTDHFEGELVIRNNEAYHNDVLVAVYNSKK